MNLLELKKEYKDSYNEFVKESKKLDTIKDNLDSLYPSFIEYVKTLKGEYVSYKEDGNDSIMKVEFVSDEDGVISIKGKSITYKYGQYVYSNIADFRMFYYEEIEKFINSHNVVDKEKFEHFFNKSFEQINRRIDSGLTIVPKFNIEWKDRFIDKINNNAIADGVQNIKSCFLVLGVLSNEYYPDDLSIELIQFIGHGNGTYTIYFGTSVIDKFEVEQSYFNNNSRYITMEKFKKKFNEIMKNEAEIIGIKLLSNDEK
jgi:hypothetical protein